MIHRKRTLAIKNKRTSVEESIQMNNKVPSALIVGVDNNIGYQISINLVERGFDVVGLDCDPTLDSPSRAVTGDWFTVVKATMNSSSTCDKIDSIIKQKNIAYLVFAQHYHSQNTVLSYTDEEIKNSLFFNIELPLSIIKTVSTYLNDRSRVTFLGNALSHIPIAHNGLNSGSKTAMSFLAHAMRLESPVFLSTTVSVTSTDQTLLKSDANSLSSSDKTYAQGNSFITPSLDGPHKAGYAITNMLVTSSDSEFTDTDWVFEV